MTFLKGDVLKLEKNLANSSAEDKNGFFYYNARKFNYVIYIRFIDDNHILTVGIRKDDVGDGIPLEIKGKKYFAFYHRLVCLNVKCISKTNLHINNANEAISQIYGAYNSYKEEHPIKNKKTSYYYKKHKFNHNRIISYSNTGWSIKHPFRSF